MHCLEPAFQAEDIGSLGIPSLRSAFGRTRPGLAETAFQAEDSEERSQNSGERLRLREREP